MTPAIYADALSKGFGLVPALSHVGFEVPSGTVLGMLGPNGAGKSTTVRILATLTRPDAGTAYVLGRDVRRQPAEVRALIGLAGQHPAVDDRMTARENLHLVGRLTHHGRRRTRKRTEALLERLDLTDAADRTVRTYSGGMRRKVDLAAALLHEPPVLFLDEPTAGLDLRTRTEIWTIIQEVAAFGTTVLLTSQYLEETDFLSHRVVVLDQGRVVGEGTPAELKERYSSTVVEVRLSDGGDAARAASALSAFGTVQILPSTPVCLELKVRGASDAVLLDVVRVLDDAEVRPCGLRSEPASLDDAFLALTGRPVGTEGAAA